MSSTTSKLLILFAVIIAVGVGLVFWKDRIMAHGGDLHSMSAHEMELLVSEMPPMQQAQLAQSPEAKQQLVKNLQEMLAIANQAQKEGYGKKHSVEQEMEYSKKAILALSYDKYKNKDEQMAPLSMIGPDQVAAYWGEDPAQYKKEQEKKQKEMEEAQKDPEAYAKKKAAEQNKPNTEEQPPAKVLPKPEGAIGKIFDSIGLGSVISGAKVNRHEAEFEKFLEAQKEVEKEKGMRPEGAEMSPEQVSQMREAFAKFSIYEDEAEANWGKLPQEFKDKVALQTKLQQAQILAGSYVQEKLAKELDFNEQDVQNYIKAHPELTKESQTKAEEVLKKAQAGDDFSALAKEYSQDPGSSNKGGLYENIQKGQMVPEFEKAALALEPGQVSPNLVTTKYGYHIIKLEKKGETKEIDGKPVEVYSARHILIPTMVKDPSGQNPQGVQLDQFAMQQLKKEKSDEILAKILKDNPVSIAEDFKINPPPMPPQQQMPGGLQQLPPGAEQPEGPGNQPPSAAPPAPRGKK
ncbi:MAG: peptidylprolyl isomerase [Pyrinomonadaceae bacterium]